MKNPYFTNLLILACINLTSCLGIKYLEDGETILSEQKVEGYKGIGQDVYSILKQTPNSKLLGLPFVPEVYIYYWGLNGYDTSKYSKKIQRLTNKYDAKIIKAKKPKKRKRLGLVRERKSFKWQEKSKEGNWRMRQGRKLEVYDPIVQRTNIEQLDQLLKNNGYLRGRVSSKVSFFDRNFAKVEYNISQGDQFEIDSIMYETPDSTIYGLINGEGGLKHGVKYHQNLLIDERERVYETLTDAGYFNFSHDYVFFELDTFTIGKSKILLREIIGNPEYGKHNKIEIDSVIFSSAPTSAMDNRIEKHNGYTFNFAKDHQYSTSLLSSRFFIKKNEFYNRSKGLETQRQLLNLDIFKFVNIDYDTLDGKFISSISTSPLKKYDTSGEIGFSSTTGLPGPFLSFNIKNRNPFQGLEILQINGNLNLQGIGDIQGEDDRSLGLLQYGGDISLNFPKFLFPIGKRLRNKINHFNPKSTISFRYNYEDRFNEYERQIISGAFGYQWQVDDKMSYKLTPFNIGSVYSSLSDEFSAFLDTLKINGNGSYAASFDPALLTTASFDATININGYGSKLKNSSLLRLFIESGGAGLQALGDWLFNISPVKYRYAKFMIDYRDNKILNRKTVLASRVHAGVAFPFGESPTALPYEKYFYIGGSNSIRAWPARRLGPGDFSVYEPMDYHEPERVINYVLEQGGDLILESSIELRFKMTNYIGWAAFIDAGNIWQIRSQPLTLSDQEANTLGRSGKFSLDEFPAEIAVGAGIGLRIDFDYLILRIDGAVQVFDPAQDKSNRFVLDDIDLFSVFKTIKTPNSSAGINLQEKKDFLQNKTRLNFGIGFPF